MHSTSDVHFIYAYPLDRERRTLFENKGLAYPTIDEVKNTMSRWELLWREVNTSHGVIASIQEITQRKPERNLECFVFGAGLNAMSTPFLLPIWNKEGKIWSDEKCIEIIIHELLHIFLATNTENYWSMIREKYATEEPLCRNHILLYALLYKIYQTLFNTEPIDFHRDNLPVGYARAVAFVRQIGYEALIAEYQEFIA